MEVHQPVEERGGRSRLTDTQKIKWRLLRSRFCCMDSERYRLTVLFLKTFFKSWALSVKLNTKKKERERE